MSWECGCGVVNPDSVTVCKACETPKGMTWQSVLEHPERATPQAQAWKQLSDQIGGEFIVLGWDQSIPMRPLCKVRARVKNWTIILDDFRPELVKEYDWGIKSKPVIRMRAPYVAKDQFWFDIIPIFRPGLLSMVTKLSGILKVIKVGDPNFDGRFIVRSNDPSKARALLRNIKIRHLIRSRDWRLKVPHFKILGLFTPLRDLTEPPEGVVRTLYFESSTLIPTEIKELNSLFELFSETLNQLVVIGSASEEASNVEV